MTILAADLETHFIIWRSRSLWEKAVQSILEDNTWTIYNTTEEINWNEFHARPWGVMTVVQFCRPTNLFRSWDAADISKISGSIDFEKKKSNFLKTI